MYENFDAEGARRFEHISKLSFSLLSLPYSNASVERAFSIVNLIKDKLRNRMSVQTADVILRVRFLLQNSCVDFEPTFKMLKRFTSEQISDSEFVEEILDAIHQAD